VTYINPEEVWYVFPFDVFAGRTMLSIPPRGRKSWYDEYREAWALFREASGQAGASV